MQAGEAQQDRELTSQSHGKSDIDYPYDIRPASAQINAPLAHARQKPLSEPLTRTLSLEANGQTASQLHLHKDGDKNRFGPEYLLTFNFQLFTFNVVKVYTKVRVRQSSHRWCYGLIQDKH